LFRSAAVNSYPRVGDQPGQQKLRAAIAHHDTGALSDEELRAVEDQVTAEVIAEQERAGVDLVTDGQVRWYDSLAPFARGLEGFGVAGLARWFDTNTYFRQPVVTGDVAWRGPILVRDYELAKSRATREVKAVITGPYTLAKLSIDRHYGRLGSLATAIAHALRSELSALAAAGATFLQIDEPALARHKKDFPVVAESLAVLVDGLPKTARICLSTTLGELSSLFLDVLDLPVDVLGIDVARSDVTWLQLRKRPFRQALQLGILDARNTRLEPAADVVDRLVEMRLVLRGRDVWIAPSAGLEFLPRDAAYRKLERAAEIARLAQERIG
jgi:5-methyltetrahydropteroyltriglutamate--homocysteine methyltransferase